MPRRVVEFKIQFAVKLASLSLRVEPGIPSLLNVIGSTNPMVQTICHDTCDIDLYSIFTENILDRRVAGPSAGPGGSGWHCRLGVTPAVHHDLPAAAAP